MRPLTCSNVLYDVLRLFELCAIRWRSNLFTFVLFYEVDMIKGSAVAQLVLLAYNSLRLAGCVW